jgi:hypothetical protein
MGQDGSMGLAECLMSIGHWWSWMGLGTKGWAAKLGNMSLDGLGMGSRGLSTKGLMDLGTKGLDLGELRQ